MLFAKELISEILQNSQKNTFAEISYFNKLQASLQLLKRTSTPGVFLWNFYKFLKTTLHRIPLTDCFIYLKLIGVTEYNLKFPPQRPFFVCIISYVIRYSHCAHISTKKLKHERPFDGDLKKNRKIALSKKDWVISAVKGFFPKNCVKQMQERTQLHTDWNIQTNHYHMMV